MHVPNFPNYALKCMETIASKKMTKSSSFISTNVHLIKFHKTQQHKLCALLFLYSVDLLHLMKTPAGMYPLLLHTLCLILMSASFILIFK